jgi:hypothetical protein
MLALLKLLSIWLWLVEVARQAVAVEQVDY